MLNFDSYLENLRSIINNYHTLNDVLSAYMGDDYHNIDSLIDDLKYQDIIWVMSDQNGMTESDMSLWIKDNANSEVKCSIFKEVGPAGGWPVVKIECLDKTFFFDWAD